MWKRLRYTCGESTGIACLVVISTALFFLMTGMAFIKAGSHNAFGNASASTQAHAW